MLPPVLPLDAAIKFDGFQGVAPKGVERVAKNGDSEEDFFRAIIIDSQKTAPPPPT